MTDPTTFQAYVDEIMGTRPQTRLSQLPRTATNPAFRGVGSVASPFNVAPPPATNPFQLGTNPSTLGGRTPFPTTVNARPGIGARLTAPLSNPLSGKSRSIPFGRMAGTGLRVGAPLTFLAAPAIEALTPLLGEDDAGFDPSDVGQFASGAARWGGMASPLAALGPVGLGAAGAIGVAGGLASALGIGGGGGQDDPLARFKSADSTLGAFDEALAEIPGLSSTDAAQLRGGLAAQLELAETAEQRQQIAAQYAQQAIGAVQARAQQQEQFTNSLALQAAATELFAPFAEQNQATADLAQELFSDPNIPESLRPLAQAHALAAQQRSDAMTQRLFTTAMARPRAEALLAETNRIDSIARQITQQTDQAGIQSYLGGGGGGGVSQDDFASLAAELGLAG